MKDVGFYMTVQDKNAPDLVPLYKISDEMGNHNKQSWDKLWNSPEAEKVRATVRCCDRECWMIGAVSPAMHKYV